MRESCYLGQILTEDDDDGRCIEESLRNARKKWMAISRILKSEGADPECMAKFYMAVVQAVLLYCADSWVVKNGDL